MVVELDLLLKFLSTNLDLEMKKFRGVLDGIRGGSGRSDASDTPIEETLRSEHFAVSKVSP